MDKSAEIVQELALAYQNISVVNGFYNDVATIIYGEENYNELGRAPEQMPSVKIIINDLSIPEFSTKSCSRTHIEVTVHGYINKGTNREAGFATYEQTLNWSKDLRDAFRNYLNNQNGGDVDADLLDSDLRQSIGYSNNIITVSSSFTLGFDEKLGV